MKRIFFLLTILLLVFSCENPVDGTGFGAGTRSLAYDADNEYLGEVITASGWGVQLYTPNGYFVGMNWDGSMQESILYFSEIDGGGIPFYSYISNFHGKTLIFVRDRYYSPKEIDIYGNGAVDDTITSYKSMLSTNGLYNMNIEGGAALPIGYLSTPFKEIQYSELGLPETIQLPITIDWN